MPSRCAYSDPAEVQETPCRDHCDVLERLPNRRGTRARHHAFANAAFGIEPNRQGTIGQSSVVLTSVKVDSSAPALCSPLCVEPLHFQPAEPHRVEPASRSPVGSF